MQGGKNYWLCIKVNSQLITIGYPTQLLASVIGDLTEIFFQKNPFLLVFYHKNV